MANAIITHLSIIRKKLATKLSHSSIVNLSGYKDRSAGFLELGRFVVEGGKGTAVAGIVLETETAEAN